MNGENTSGMTTLMVHQQKEWGEILTNFEFANRYTITDESGRELFQAGEEGGSFLVRTFLKTLRPFTIRILQPNGASLITVNRPFRFYFHKIDILGPDSTPLGSIQRQFSVLRRIYSVLDASGSEVYQLFGPLLHPWTFQILEDGVEIGKITKKWSGLLKEAFTDADTFGVTFPSGISTDRKYLVLGAVFLIDFVHFEGKSGGG